MAAHISNTPLRKARLYVDRTQAEVAAAAGLTQGQYSRIERGAPTTPETASRISRSLGGRVSEVQILYPKRFRNYRP